jgi:hypothetical protein
LGLYSVIILPDSEKEFSLTEIESLRFNFENSDLSVFIISEWNDNNILNYIKKNLGINENYNEKNIYNGSEISSINRFLNNYGFEIQEDSLSYEFSFNKINLKVG